MHFDLYIKNEDVNISMDDMFTSYNETSTDDEKTTDQITDHEDFKTNENNNWNTRKEQQLRDWQQKCKIRSYCHSMTYEYYTSQFKRCILFNIISSVLATIFNGAALLDPINVIPLTLIALCSSALVAGVGTWLQSSNPANTASANAKIASSYQRIIIEIDSELTNDLFERVNGTKFIHRISHQITELTNSAVIIPLDILTHVINNVANGTLDISQLQGNIINVPLPESHTINESPIIPTPDSHTINESDLVPRSELRIPRESTDFMVEYQMNRFGIS